MVGPRPSGDARASVTALVAARDEEDVIGDTVAALRSIPAIDRVVVVDDASLDRTAERARRAGATVLSGRSMGKGDAVEAALDRAPRAGVYVLADGDLGASANGVEPLLETVAAGEADLAVGALPPPPTGGFGLVRRFAAALVEVAAGFRPRAPLSGQRAITHECLWACRPLARGFGLEAAMTADAVRMGFRVKEVEVDVEHRFTGKDLPGFVHRALQGAHIARAMVPRLARLR